MFTRILGMLAISTIIIHSVESNPVVNRGRQFLPTLPGYVPVYIRAGDTPLEDINPDLAEAFNSYARKHARLTFARANSIPVPVSSQGKIQVHIESDLSNLDQLDLDDENAVTRETVDSQHIQKIPRH